jgi:hypothetical protein
LVGGCDVSGRSFLLIFKSQVVQEECREQVDAIWYRGWCGPLSVINESGSFILLCARAEHNCNTHKQQFYARPWIQNVAFILFDKQIIKYFPLHNPFCSVYHTFLHITILLIIYKLYTFLKYIVHLCTINFKIQIPTLLLRTLFYFLCNSQIE